MLEPLATLSPPRARPLVGMAMALDDAEPSLDGAESRLADGIVLFIREPPLATEKLLLLRKMLLGAAAVTDLSADIFALANRARPPRA